jgi:hypothetical protein
MVYTKVSFVFVRVAWRREQAVVPERCQLLFFKPRRHKIRAPPIYLPPTLFCPHSPHSLHPLFPFLAVFGSSSLTTPTVLWGTGPSPAVFYHAILSLLWFASFCWILQFCRHGGRSSWRWRRWLRRPSDARWVQCWRRRQRRTSRRWPRWWWWTCRARQP